MRPRAERLVSGTRGIAPVMGADFGGATAIGSMMTLGYAGQIWVPLLTFPTVQAPSFPKGYPSSLAFLIGMWGLFLYGFFYMRR